ncbi:lipopolysaccharide biosynthesis protein [Cellulophaga sp. Asnod2-G02]|uniref:lipopolysaccharide biosynthesis protein n=1 Tax=Cellulophaga sp. Asnod2-G02 TaxID=3160572 RepID=UPI003863B478
MSIKNKATSGFGWTAFEGIFSQGVIFLVGIILARILTPIDFGIIGIMTVFIAISTTLVEGGFSDALIRKTDSTSLDNNTIFIVNMTTSIVLYILLFIFSENIANYFEIPILNEILRYSGLIIIINALMIIQRTIFLKNLSFKIISSITITSSILSSIVAITLAYNDFGIWSLVVLNILKPSIICILMWFKSSWKPSLIFSKNSFKELFNFGYKILLSKLINTIYKNVYYIVIGKFFTPTALGYYTRADQFQSPFSVNITQAISRISYPILASTQNDLITFKRYFIKFIRFAVFINFTVLAILAAISKPLIILSIGEKWSTSIFYLQLLCIPGMLYPLQILNLNLLTSLGYSNLMLKLEICKKIILIPLLGVSVFFGIEIMLYCLVSFSIIEYFINSFFTKKLINYSILEQLKDIFPFLTKSIIIFLLTFSITFFQLTNISTILIQLSMSVFLFVTINELTKNSEYLEIKNKLKSIIKLNYGKK